MAENHRALTSICFGTGAAIAVASLTNALGAAVALGGCSSPGIIAHTLAASAMSIAWKTGIGPSLVSAAQSAGALFVNATGGSVVVAVAAVAVPVLVGATVGYYIYYPEAFQNMTDTVKNSFQNWCKVASQSSNPCYKNKKYFNNVFVYGRH